MVRHIYYIYYIHIVHILCIHIYVYLKIQLFIFASAEFINNIFLALEIVFAIDVTASIDGSSRRPQPQNLGYMLSFTQNLMQSFNISVMTTNVGVLTFSNETHVQTGLTADRDVFNKAIEDSKKYCCKGKALTHLALNTADRIFENSSRNIATSKALVLLTDSTCNGNDTCPEPLENVAQRLNARGVNIFIADISAKSDKELKAVGSQPGNSYFLQRTFSDLQNRNLVFAIRDQIRQGIFLFLNFSLHNNLKFMKNNVNNFT